VVLIIAVVTAAYFLTGNNSGLKPEVLSVLRVESDPTGANVFLNGSLKGQTPLKVDLPLGKYEILLSRQNHMNGKPRFSWMNRVKHRFM
jgi:hypothetical protein